MVMGVVNGKDEFSAVCMERNPETLEKKVYILPLDKVYRVVDCVFQIFIAYTVKFGQGLPQLFLTEVKIIKEYFFNI